MRLDACRACGCTEDRACPGGCSWFAVERPSRRFGAAPPLCSACAGTPADLVEALQRIAATRRRFGNLADVADQAGVIARAALKRLAARRADVIAAAQNARRGALRALGAAARKARK